MGRQRDPALRYPSKLRQYLGQRQLGPVDLRVIRRQIDRDEPFRNLAATHLGEVDDPIIRLWIERPDGWAAELTAMDAERSRRLEEAAVGSEAARESRRRQAAESRADAAESARDAAEHRLDDVAAQLRQVSADSDALRAEIARLRAELSESRTDLRHERDRHAAAIRRLHDAQEDKAAATQGADREAEARHAAQRGRDEAIAERAELREIIDEARRLSARIAELAPASDRATREPLSVPGRFSGDQVARARHLIGSGATVIVDGYNVAKRWKPTADLRTQRELLFAAVEVMVARHSADLVVVFDGDDVVGSHTSRRSPVRVIWSPRGTTADDVIRAEVQRLPLTRPVVVVTDDREIIGDVRTAGANHVSSAAFIGVLET